MVTPLLALFAVALTAAEPAPEERAVAFLAREVPRWSPANQCFSCHNNGDGARALYAASRLRLPDRALADTAEWLQQPDRWEKIGAERYNDKTLVAIQFAAALAEAADAKRIKDPKPLVQAAGLVARQQHHDGSWKVDVGGSVGSPVTYGTALATAQARHVLNRADEKQFAAAIKKADRWLRQVDVKTVLDAAAVLLALGGDDDESAQDQRKRCLELIRQGQSKDSGWGPYVTSAPEPFDTAVVLLALLRLKDRQPVQTMIRAGRSFLIGSQEQDGGWPATTRPAGADSYAQRISTSAWATLALLASKKP